MKIHKVQNKAIIYQKILNNSYKQSKPRKYYESMLNKYKFTPLQIRNLEEKFAYKYSQMINIDYEKAVKRKLRKNIPHNLSIIWTTLKNKFKKIK